MTQTSIKEAFLYRKTMRKFLESGAVLDGADDWIRMELHNQQREMQREVAASLRKEREEKALEMERASGQGDSKLSAYLKHLISLIVPRLEAERNG